MSQRPPISNRTDTLFPYTALYRSRRMGGGDEQLPDGVLVLGRHAGPALAAPLLRAEGVQRRALDIAAHGHGHDHVLPLDQVFVVDIRSEEHTSELQSLMRISYAVFCLKQKTKAHITHKGP